ncbi:type VII secretion protein EsaA [Staphylococcus hyicus]|uniref:type VII secretion protein EsaA n=1 Tax=Staphylococcus hyicus TaxID=1284 RepID=UPI00057C9EEE|nr:type VII secretion protein EsaA [Staphylococcus hyicus]AJC97014.1 type VII secretion protein EsaA [Staphylococcus hyicus]RTX70272.1 type VII secretion protein EsaA [Staphylococcus hyicus]SQE49358.1 secretion accessory protein EsaA/YueB [Staphylococcus hyicus]
MKKKKWIIGALAIFILLSVILALFIMTQNKETKENSKNDNPHNEGKNVKIAIVNEDQPTTYNGSKVELGKPFVKMLSHEDSHDFETVSRHVAENGLKHGQYQVMVVIPKNFSKLAMQLDEKSPSQMTLQYKTAVGQKENVARETEKVVSDLLSQFNERLIQIYLSSIIDNLHNAQKNVDDIMSRQGLVDQRFSNYLVDPLNDFPRLFTDLMVHSISANKDITTWIREYNQSLLSSDYKTFQLPSDENVSTLVNQQQETFAHYLSEFDKTIEDYQSQKDSVDLSRYIQQLQTTDEGLKHYKEMSDSSKDAYEEAFKSHLEDIKKEIEAEESPFTEDMIDVYKEKLTESMKHQLEENPELNDALSQMKDQNEKLRNDLLQNMLSTIQKDPAQQNDMYIANLSHDDLTKIGLSDEKVEAYQKILTKLNEFKRSYNEAHPNNPVVEEPYHNELTADDTSSLISKGVSIERKETLKSKDINQLSVAVDKNFDFDGEIKINGKSYDIKNQDIKLDTSEKTYNVEVKGTAKLKSGESYKTAFLKDKTMHLQLVFGAANQSDDNTSDGPTTTPDTADKGDVSVVDISIHHNLEGLLIHADVKDQLRALDRFDNYYDIYNSQYLTPNAPELNNDTIIKMLVDEVVNEMSAFKNDKTTILQKIDELNQSSSDLISEMLQGQEGLLDNQKELSALIKELDDTNQTFQENPKKPEVDKDKEEDFVTLSTKIDKDIQTLSERSTQLLTDSQKSQSTANTVSSELNQLDTNVTQLHASGRALGERANAINRDMTNNAKQNKLFAEHFERVLKHSKDGDKQNEALKAFMSHPIQKKNLENVLANSDEKDTTSPSIFVLLMYLMSMMTAYVFYSYERAKGELQFIHNHFSQHNKIWNSIAVAGVISGVALLEGLVIGLVAMNQFEILEGYRLKFIVMVVLTMSAFVLVNTYLLRQIRTIGMLMMLGILAIYFVAMNQLGQGSAQTTLGKISPLSYVDAAYFNFLNAEQSTLLVVILLFVITIIGFLLNLVIKPLNKVRLF